jgi:predicted oxidoreductase
MTYGGLRIDEHARVLNAAGTPIPGLFAAGADGAGLNCVGYAGGLSGATIFAMQAVDATSGSAPGA